MLVLGIGNKLMMDDGVGNDVVEYLRDNHALAGIQYRTGETDVDYCLWELMRPEAVVIIDAGRTGLEPCTVSVASLCDVLEEMPAAELVHDLDLFSAMKRYGIKKSGLLITVEACEIDFRIGLSGEMSLHFEQICKEAGNIINTYYLYKS